MSEIDYEQSLNSAVPIFKPIFSDYSIFYFGISVFLVFFAFLFLLNFVLGCCSQYSDYWNDKFTGNRLVGSLWISSPKNQPPIELSESIERFASQQPKPQTFAEAVAAATASASIYSSVGNIRPETQPFYPQHSYIGPHQVQEFFELQTTNSQRESAI